MVGCAGVELSGSAQLRLCSCSTPGSRPVTENASRCITPAGAWTYRRLFETANRIAHVLVEELGLVPGGRVLLRAPNQPMLVACWFAVLKAGGVAVTTMPLLRPRELTEIIERADVGLALTDTRVAGDLEAVLSSRPAAQCCILTTPPRIHWTPGWPRTHRSSRTS